MLWFSQVVFRWRTAAAAAWLLILAVPGLLAFQLLAACSPLHPLQGLTGCLAGLSSPRSVLFGFLYLSSLVGVSLLFSLTYTVKLPLHKTRLQVLWSALTPRRAVVVLLYALLGGGGAYCLAELGGFGRLWKECQGHERCLNERQLFCGLHGAFLGLCFGMSYFVNKEHFLVFPSIQQQKLFRLRGHLSSHLWEGFLWTLKGLRFYYPLYYLIGVYPRKKLMNTFELHLREDASLTSVSGLLDAGLLLHLLLSGTMLHLSWGFGLRLFRAFHTEALKFPVVATFAGESSRLLTTALKAQSAPLLMYLGYLDLYQLSLHSIHRRREVYSLNQSGQPAVWNDINTACLSLLTSLTTKLGGRSPEEDVVTASMIPPSASTNGVSFPTSKGWSDPPLGTLSPPGVTRRNVYNERARLWSYSPGVEGMRRPLKLAKEVPTEDTPLKKLKQMVSALKALPKKIADRLKKKPFFAFFLAELPEAAHQELFADCRLHVWAITGIAELTAASYMEDTYGVVQRTLPKILTSLITLSQALDKHVKAPLSSSKSTRNVRAALETNGRYALKTAVQTALNRLATTFAMERRSLQLSEDHLHYWSTFLGAVGSPSAS